MVVEKVEPRLILSMKFIETSKPLEKTIQRILNNVNLNNVHKYFENRLRIVRCNSFSINNIVKFFKEINNLVRCLDYYDGYQCFTILEGLSLHGKLYGILPLLQNILYIDVYELGNSIYMAKICNEDDICDFTTFKIDGFNVSEIVKFIRSELIKKKRNSRYYLYDCLYLREKVLDIMKKVKFMIE